MSELLEDFTHTRIKTSGADIAAGLDGADVAGHGLCLHFRQTRAGAGRVARRWRMTNPFSIWVYLSATPLLWLALTLVAWIVADAIARACGRHPRVNPVLIAIGTMARF